jgi:hypothetical protein
MVKLSALQYTGALEITGRCVMAKYKLSLRDNSREVGRSDFNIDPITVGNIGDILTAVGTFRTAVEGITLGVGAKESLVMDETNLSALAPTNPNAQRGIKWKVQYSDNTPFFDPPVNAIPNAGYQQIFTNSIPTADLSLLDDGEEELDLTAGPGLAFKTAFDAFVKSPYGGDTVLLRVYYAD